MKNKKRLGFLSAILGVCISATSVIGTVAFAEGEGQAPTYAAKADLVDIAWYKSDVNYFTKDGAAVDLTNSAYSNFDVKVSEYKDASDVVAEAVYSYTKGEIIYGKVGTYTVNLVDKKESGDTDDTVVATASVKVISKEEIADNEKYEVSYGAMTRTPAGTVEKTPLDHYEFLLNGETVKEDVTSIDLNSATLKKSFWDLVNLGIYDDASDLRVKVYLAKPKTDFSVVNSSWKAEMPKLNLSANGTYAFYVEIKDFCGNELVVDKEEMELKSVDGIYGWYTKADGTNPSTLVIPVFQFEYNKEIVTKATIEAKRTTGIIGVEHVAGKVTVENVARTTIKLYYNANSAATLSGVDALTSANGWNEATEEQASIGSLSTSSLKFTPLVKGAYAYYIEVVGSDIASTQVKAVSEVISVTQTVQEQKLVNVKFRNFLKNNWLSLVFLGVAFLCVVGIIVLAFYKPKDAEEVEAKKAAKKAKVEDAEEAEEAEEAVEEDETPAEEAEEVEETEEAPAEEVVETEEAPAEETTEEVAEEVPATEAPAEEVKSEDENA